MGNYATNTELQTRFEDVEEVAFYTDTVLATPPSTPDEAVLTDCVAGAEGAINSRLAMMYDTPVDVSLDSELAALLERMTLDLAECFLRTRKGVLSEAQQLQHDGVKEWAAMIAKGEWALPGGVTPAPTQSRGPTSSFTDWGRTLSSSSKRTTTRETMSKL